MVGSQRNASEDALAVYSLLRFPLGRPNRELPGTLSYGARTFLPLRDPDGSSAGDH
ncbi:MAG: hypothetical protein ACI855_003305 [Myxococcota bacterium]|jgi:hypothetical protein